MFLRRIVLILLASLATVLGSFGAMGPDRAAAQQGSQGINIAGSWSLSWKGARDTYAGRVDISRSTGPQRYQGKVTLLPSSGGTVTQDANITVKGSQVEIECYNPSVRGWNPDRFFLTIKGNVMEGYSRDAAGQQGSRIVLTRL